MAERHADAGVVGRDARCTHGRRDERSMAVEQGKTERDREILGNGFGAEFCFLADSIQFCSKFVLLSID